MLDGDEATRDTYDPFNPVPEPEQDKEALIRSLELAQKWTLLFVVCNSPDERDRLMDEVATQLPSKEIQRLPVAHEVGSLSDVMRQQLTTPPPEILFVYGIERWLSGAVNPRSVPFLLNLNAARDVFPEIMNGPMVVWLPQFALEAIANAAPDFFSVRSGTYTFPIAPEKLVQMMSSTNDFQQLALLMLDKAEREEKILEIEALLSEIRTSPDRDTLEEANIVRQLGTMLFEVGNFDAAEECCKEVLALQTKKLPDKHMVIVDSYTDLASVYTSQRKFDKANEIFENVLPLHRSRFPNDVKTASALFNYGRLLYDRKSYRQAAIVLQEALAIASEDVQSHGKQGLKDRIYHGLSCVYKDLHQFEKAETYAYKSLSEYENTNDSHPNVAIRLANLADIHLSLGKVADATNVIDDAADLVRQRLDATHPTRRYVEESHTLITQLSPFISSLSSAQLNTLRNQHMSGSTGVAKLLPMHRIIKKKRRK